MPVILCQDPFFVGTTCLLEASTLASLHFHRPRPLACWMTACCVLSRLNGAEILTVPLSIADRPCTGPEEDFPLEVNTTGTVPDSTTQHQHNPTRPRVSARRKAGKGRAVAQLSKPTSSIV